MLTNNNNVTAGTHGLATFNLLLYINHYKMLMEHHRAKIERSLT